MMPRKLVKLVRRLFSYQTYLIAWRKLAVVPHGAETRLWLFGVARKLLLEHARRRRSSDALVQRLAEELRRTIAAASPIDDRAGPLSDALRCLPAKEREILLLTAWEGFAPREIATITSSSPNVVRVRLARARSKLRACLDEIDPAPAPRAQAFTASPDP